MTDPTLSPATAHSPGPLDPAITAALRDLVSDGTLDEAQAATVAERLGRATRVQNAAPGPARGGRLAEIAGYLGAALLLGAVALFLTSGWEDLSEPARVVILAGLAALLLAVGGLVARSSGLPIRELGRQEESARRRLVSVLWTFAAASSAGAAGLGADGWEVVAAGATGLVVASLAYAVVPSAVGQLGMFVASIMLATGLVAEIGDEPDAAGYAVVLVALGAAWSALAVTGVLRPRELALGTAAALALFGAQLPVMNGNHQWLAYVLTGAVAVAGFAGHLATRSWSVLGAGVLATTLVVPEALHDWTDGSVSAAGSLLVAGLTLLGASAVGLRLRHEVT
jgi:hypothetical protein